MIPEDLDRVMEIAQSLKDAPHWTRANYVAVLDPAATPRRIALVAEEGVKVAGFAVASLMPPQAELEIIAVDAQFQRRGLARRLFAELDATLRLAGVTEVILEVRASNQPAQGLYRRLGFAETARRQCYYQAPADDAVLMSLGLAGLETEAANARMP
jgi:ribosomal-protein-alanine N-acetyltransferase